MQDVGKAFKALAGVFLDEATRLLNKMTDWLNARYKKLAGAWAVNARYTRVTST